MSNSASRSWLGTILLAVLLILLLGGVLLAARWLLADRAMADARAYLDSWAENQAVSSQQDWQQAHDHARRAIALNPRLADYHQQLALLYEWRGFSGTDAGLSDAAILSSRRLAAAAYRNAARLRPAWPQGWSHLARMKALAGELDEEFDDALRSAMALGRNDARVNLELTLVATLAWPYLSGDEALLAQIRAAIARGLSAPGNIRGGLGYLRDANLLDQICPQLALATMSPPVQQACET